MLDVRQLSRRFAGKLALDGLSFRIARGEVVGLLGPNGAGKSTCMRILTGFIPPSAGSVTIDGLDLQQRSLAVRQRVGYLPEGVPLYPELRVEEYLRFRARLRRIPRAKRLPAIEGVMARCGVMEVRGRIIGQLSRGYRQRVGLADALLGEPSLLVLDEPTAGLDPNQIREVRQLIRSLAGEQTVLLSSHQLAEVEAVCQRVLILDGGRLIAAGSPDEVGRSHGTGCVTLRLRAPGDAAATAFAEIDGVERVEVEMLDEATANVRVRLYGALGDETCARIAALVTASSWDLYEMRYGTTALDQAFAQLTGAGGAGESA